MDFSRLMKKLKISIYQKREKFRKKLIIDSMSDKKVENQYFTFFVYF